MIRALTVEAPELVYEKGPGGSNVEAIGNHVGEYAAICAGDAGQAGNAGTKAEASSTPRFIVESLEIRNGKVTLAGVVAKDGVVDLPDVRLCDIGKSQGGITGDEVAAVVVKQMTDAIKATAVRALARKGVERATDRVKDQIPRR